MKGNCVFGLVYQSVTRNNDLSPSAKGLYAYLSAFCGASDACCPDIETILKEMDFNKNTFYRHINALVDAGVVEKRQTKNGNRFGKTIYRLTHEINEAKNEENTEI